MVELAGKRFKFYGVWNECFKLDDKIYEAVENPDDGYRSYLGTVEVREPHPSMTFQRRRIAWVTVLETDDHYFLVDDTGHTWLKFGTDHTDCYYPCFVFEYTPKTE